MKSSRPYLLHIIEEADYLIDHSAGLEYAGFVGDENLRRSFVRSLEIIGEAVKNLPQDFRDKHPDIDWKAIAGMRDVLIHNYFGVNYKVVWDVVVNRVPELKMSIERFL